MRLTFDDLLDYLSGYAGKDVSKTTTSAIRSAAQAGIRELQGHHDWSYYRTLGRVNTVASYSTGTVAYDHTGGSSERLLTLSSGTFPSWLASGVVVISGVPYRVDERLTGTTATLRSDSNPGEDVDAGTAYVAAQEEYALPSDFGRVGNAVVALTGDANALRYADPQEMVLARRDNPTVGRPATFSVVGSIAHDGAHVMRLWPMPDAAYNIDFDYRRRPAAIRVSGEKAGLASITSASATVTGVGTNFASRMVGSVIRLSRQGQAESPTGLSGLNPAAFEGVVESVESATSLTLTAAADQTIARAQYVISDPIDVEPGSMETALYHLAAAALRMRMRILPVSGEVGEMQRALAAARDDDSRYYGDRGVYRPSYGRSVLDGPQGTSSTSSY